MNDIEHRLRRLCLRARDLLEEACDVEEKCPWCNASAADHRAACEMRKLLIDMAVEGV